MAKLYFCDTGLLCLLLGIKSPEDVSGHTLYPKIAENFMLIDVLCLFHNRAEPVTSVYFWRNHRGFEVGCLIEHSWTLRSIEFQPCTTETELDFREIARWKRESQSKFMENYIVYGGNTVKRHEEVSAVGWENALSATNGILVRNLQAFYKHTAKKK